MVALFGLLVLTNPPLERYVFFLRQKLIQESKTDGERVLAALFGGFTTWMVISQTIRKDYILFSIYDTNIENEHLKALGILNNFILLEIP